MKYVFVADIWYCIIPYLIKNIVSDHTKHLQIQSPSPIIYDHLTTNKLHKY